MNKLKEKFNHWLGRFGTKPWSLDKLETYYYNAKWTFVNYFKYAKIVARHRPWDSEYILDMMKFQLEELCHTIEKYGNEVDEDKLPKIEKMKRAIEILDAQVNDKYLERCGYISGATEFIIDEKNNEVRWELKPGYENYNEGKVFNDAEILRKKEWNELFDLLKNNLERWWD